MNEHRQGLDVGQVLGVLHERWKTVLTITLLACMAAYGYVTFAAKEIYEATALVTYQVPDRASNPTNGALPSSGITREDIGTLVANATTQKVMDAAAAELGAEASDLRRSTRVQAHGDASVVAFIARGGDATETTEQANALARAFVTERVALAKQSLDQLVKLRQENLTAAKRIKQDPKDPDPTLKNSASEALNDA
ncbi:MAG: Wzz/FepE/Etk N-terminal domain-containing protein, partial [Gaiellales bacterium]